MQPTLLAAPGEIVRGHEFHYSDFIPETPAVMACRRFAMAACYRNGLAAGRQATRLPAICTSISPSVRKCCSTGWRRRGAYYDDSCRCIARVLDFIIGDPQHWPHPVRWIGRLITFVQRIVRRYCPGDKALRIGGGVMWVVVVGATGRGMGRTGAGAADSPRFGWSVEVWMIFTTLAGRLWPTPRRRLNDRYGRTTLRKAE